MLKFFLFFLTITSTLMASDSLPSFLYKIVAIEQWEKSQSLDQLILSANDKEFIHFSTEDQVQKTADKFFKDLDYIVLKISVEKLPHPPIFECNPGGVTKYYHLYDGYVPLSSVIDTTRFPK